MSFVASFQRNHHFRIKRALTNRGNHLGQWPLSGPVRVGLSVASVYRPGYASLDILMRLVQR